MHSTIFTSVILFALGVAAAPAPSTGGNSQGSCMTKQDATKVANNFKDLINLDFSTTLAREAMTENFHDYSDGVNELINAGCQGPQRLTSATFTSRQDFINGQSTQPSIPFEILNLWHNCDTVTMRWRSSAPGYVKPEQPVTGIVVMETTPNPDSNSDQSFLMETVYSEFNSAAWLYDIGNFTASCTASGTPKKNNAMSNMVTGSASNSSSASYSASTGT